MSLANLKRSQGEAAEAQEMLAASYNAFDEGRDTADHQAAKALLDL